MLGFRKKGKKIKGCRKLENIILKCLVIYVFVEKNYSRATGIFDLAAITANAISQSRMQLAIAASSRPATAAGP